MLLKTPTAGHRRTPFHSAMQSVCSALPTPQIYLTCFTTKSSRCGNLFRQNAGIGFSIPANAGMDFVWPGDKSEVKSEVRSEIKSEVRPGEIYSGILPE